MSVNLSFCNGTVQVFPLRVMRAIPVAVFRGGHFPRAPIQLAFNLQFRRRLYRTLLPQIREPEVRVILPFPKGDVVVRRTRAH